MTWIAAEADSYFECYFDSFRTGAHHGGGAPWLASVADLQGGTFTGGHHLEQFYLLSQLFRCRAVCLGQTAYDDTLNTLGIPVLARSPDVGSFYRAVSAALEVAWPDTLLVVGRGVSAGTSLIPYACHEISARRLLGIADGDPQALEDLKTGMQVEYLWPAPSAGDSPALSHGHEVAERTVAMARRWGERTTGFLLGDAELVGRWIPQAVRRGWAPIFGIPQTEAIAALSDPISETAVVYGRQQDDRDFLELSKRGVAFQLVDPGRPPFPVMAEAELAPHRLTIPEPDDEQLLRWAQERRVLVSLVFWAGMVRELECMYALADVLSLTGARAGIALTTESFRYMPGPPLTLLQVPRELGGLAPNVEPLIASAGAGAMIESAAPGDRFAAILAQSMAELAERLGGDHLLPRGWWSVLDARLISRAERRLALAGGAPFLRVRYHPRPLAPPEAAQGSGSGGLRSRIRQSPLHHFFDPWRPFDGFRPGGPLLSIQKAVRAAGFEYALTKASFGGAPRAAEVDGLTILNQTAGRWDGWTPFVTVNTIADLARAERRLVRTRRPGWVLGTLDTCLWTFTGPLWDRAAELKRLCAWVAGGGSSGRLVNVTPRVAARYARLLSRQGQVGRLPLE